ncbi:MAG: transglutaminase domain-containing protein [Deltaproteobacteria bacterium]|nr:transglutaminase domain-containing protein [Deltaproteobacteria bacterium]
MAIRHSEYLSPTDIIDSNHERIIEYAGKVAGDETDPAKVAVRLYYAVRDGIWYDPYVPFHLAKHYRASSVLEKGRGYCVYKASLLCALGRARGIETRVGFADVRNHLATRQLVEFMGTDIFACHGYSEFFLGGKWIKATPAFNVELCKRHGVAPLEFDGIHDSVFQPFDLEHNQFMDYVKDRGTFADIPIDVILDGWKEVYGEDRVQAWIEIYEQAGDKSPRDFYKEDII